MDNENRIVLICSNLGNIIIYGSGLTIKEIEEWFEKANNEKANDVVEIKQDQIMFYCIDDRIWMDSKKDESIRLYLKR